MLLIEIDPELNRLALAEAVQKYPELAEQASGVVARPLSQGGRVLQLPLAPGP